MKTVAVIANDKNFAEYIKGNLEAYFSPYAKINSYSIEDLNSVGKLREDVILLSAYTIFPNVKSKIPDADDEVVSTVVKLVHNIRNLNLMKKPSVRGTVDWVKSVSNLGTKNMDKSLKDSIGVAIKNESDKKRVVKDVLDKR